MTSKNIHKLCSGNNSVSKEFRGDHHWKSTNVFITGVHTLQTPKTQLLDVTNIQTFMSTIFHIS